MCEIVLCTGIHYKLNDDDDDDDEMPYVYEYIILFSVRRFYTFCLPVRCCRAFDAAGPTTSGTKLMTAAERGDR